MFTRREFAAVMTAFQLRKVPNAVGVVEQTIPPHAIVEVGGFIGGRLRSNNAGLMSFDIGQFVQMVEEKKHRDWWWIGEQPGKWVESSIHASAWSHNPALQRKAEGALARLMAAQDADGYMGITDPALRTPRHPVRGMDAYELYFTLHALLAARELWGSEPALVAARRLGDFFLARIGPGKAEFWPLPKPVTVAGHEVHYSLEGTLLIDPMMRLYEMTTDRRYLAWCEWCVGNIDRWSVSDTFSNLDKVAAGKMNLNEIQPNVHAHTLHMNLLGFLRLYQATGDRKYLAKVTGAWHNILANYRYVTGGVSVGEGYGEPHKLPNTGSVVETCASMSWLLLNQYLLELTADVGYADAIERLMWNHLFAAQTWDGDGFRYHCSPNGWKPAGYYTGPDCCSASGARILAMLPEFFYASSPDAVYVNQYVESSVRLSLESTAVTLRQITDYPASEKVIVEVGPERPGAFTVNMRLPAWCPTPALRVNGEAVRDLVWGSYAAIKRTWKPGDQIELTLPMRTRWLRGEHTNAGLVALERGPVVFALDTVWQDEATATLLTGDGKSDNFPVLRSVGDAARPAAVPAGALGPAFEIDAVFQNGRRIPVLMLPFANLGKWYRTAEEKAGALSEIQQQANARSARMLKGRTWPYAVWLPRV